MSLLGTKEGRSREQEFAPPGSLDQGQIKTGLRAPIILGEDISSARLVCNKRSGDRRCNHPWAFFDKLKGRFYNQCSKHRCKNLASLSVMWSMQTALEMCQFAFTGALAQDLKTLSDTLVYAWPIFETVDQLVKIRFVDEKTQVEDRTLWPSTALKLTLYDTQVLQQKPDYLLVCIPESLQLERILMALRHWSFKVDDSVTQAIGQSGISTLPEESQILLLRVENNTTEPRPKRSRLIHDESRPINPIRTDHVNRHQMKRLPLGESLFLLALLYGAGRLYDIELPIALEAVTLVNNTHEHCYLIIDEEDTECEFRLRLSMEHPHTKSGIPTGIFEGISLQRLLPDNFWDPVFQAKPTPKPTGATCNA